MSSRMPTVLIILLSLPRFSKITDDNKFEENNRVNVLLTFAAVIFLCRVVQPVQPYCLFQPTVKIFRRHTIGQLELLEQFFGVMFFALHHLSYNLNIAQNKYLYEQSVSCATSTLHLCHWG